VYKIIFFDIDKTLFDREKYLDNFYIVLASNFDFSSADVAQVKIFYEQVKEEFGYFTPEALLVKIYEKFPKLDNKLNYYFEAENLGKFLFDDSSVVRGIKNARIGIFSMGDTKFQKAKITLFQHVLEEDLIYIFHEKTGEFETIANKYPDSELFLIDDKLHELIGAKDSGAKTILVDREGKITDLPNGVDFKVDSLFDIIPILDENT
jgi:FMN phosphatase YigB (HAD superfamily)